MLILGIVLLSHLTSMDVRLLYSSTGLWKRFHVFRAGNTNDAHHDFVNKLKEVGHTEVDFREGFDYLVVFCPIASRVQTDIKEALDKMSHFGQFHTC